MLFNLIAITIFNGAMFIDVIDTNQTLDDCIEGIVIMSNGAPDVHFACHTEELPK